MAKAKVFSSGSSQAVWLPKGFGFPPGTQEVAVRREGERLILEPIAVRVAGEWPADFWRAFEGMSEDFKRPDQGPPDRKREPLDDQ